MDLSTTDSIENESTINATRFMTHLYTKILYILDLKCMIFKTYNLNITKLKIFYAAY